MLLLVEISPKIAHHIQKKASSLLTWSEALVNWTSLLRCLLTNLLLSFQTMCVNLKLSSWRSLWRVFPHWLEKEGLDKFSRESFTIYLLLLNFGTRYVLDYWAKHWCTCMVWYTCIGQSSGLWAGCERTSPHRGVLSNSACHSLAPVHLQFHYWQYTLLSGLRATQLLQWNNQKLKGLATRLLTMNIFPFSFQHPNFIQLMGYYSTPPALIFPFMEPLSLYYRLHAYKV